MTDNTLGETDFLWSSMLFRVCVGFGLIISWPIVILFLDARIISYGLTEIQGGWLRLLNLTAVTGLMFYLMRSMGLVCDGETKDFNYRPATISMDTAPTFFPKRYV